MSIAETETKLSLPTPSDMPDEVWGLWLPSLEEWHYAGNGDAEDGIVAFFGEEPARDYATDHYCDYGELVPVLLWRKGVR